MWEVIRQADQSRVRIQKSCKQRARVEVSTHSRGEAFCCLFHFMLLIGPGNPGLQDTIQSQST